MDLKTLETVIGLISIIRDVLSLGGKIKMNRLNTWVAIQTNKIETRKAALSPIRSEFLTILQQIKPFFTDNVSYSFLSICQKEQMNYDGFNSKINSLDNRFSRLYQEISNHIPLDRNYTEIKEIISETSEVMVSFVKIIKQRGWLSDESKNSYHELYCNYNPVILVHLEPFLNKNIPNNIGPHNDVYFQPLPDINNIAIKKS